jgi:hypothetical protein
MGRVKGMCYGNDAFPAPYNPSNANSFQCTFGSDSTADYVAPLFGPLQKFGKLVVRKRRVVD